MASTDHPKYGKEVYVVGQYLSRKIFLALSYNCNLFNVYFIAGNYVGQYKEHVHPIGDNDCVAPASTKGNE